MNPDEKNLATTIKSVDKALEILEAFSELKGGIKLSRLSEQLNMNRSGVYRLLQVFKQRGYVEQRSKNGTYHLGLSAYMVGQKIVSNMELTRIARPIMERLVREANETVYLALRCEQDLLLFDSVEALHPVSVKSLKGRRYPLAQCAAGRVLLREDALQGAARRHGFSSDVHQLGEGVASLAVPLFNDEGEAVGSLCFVGPEYRLSDDKVRESLLKPLIDAGQTISAQLGYLDYYMA